MANTPFARGTSISSASFTSNGDQLKTGDFNGDGFIDFVVARIDYQSVGERASPIQVFLGNGKGEFSDKTMKLFSGVIPYTNYVPRMIIADFNNDRVDDIFCIDTGIDKYPFSGGQNELFLSRGGKLIDARINLPQGLKNNHGASVGDVNKDGNPDILVNALMNDGNDLQVNDGAGKFVSSPALMPNLMVVPEWAPDSSTLVTQTNTFSGLIDVNKDGYVDMILGTWNNNPNPSQVFLNQGGGFANSAPIVLPRSGVDNEIVLGVNPIDLNGDDLPDLALSITNGGDYPNFYQSGYVQLLTNLGNGVFSDETGLRLPQSLQAGNSTRWYKSVNVSDINRDGFSDLMIDDYGKAPVVYLNDGTGKFTKLYRTPNQYNFGAIGDVNNDGMLDLITRDGDKFISWINKIPNQRVYKANFGGEKLLGSSGNDSFYVRDGSSILNGAAGKDTLFLDGDRDAYQIKRNSSGVLITNTDLTGTSIQISYIEKIQFADKSINIKPPDVVQAVSFSGFTKSIYKVGTASYALAAAGKTVGDALFNSDRIKTAAGKDYALLKAGAVVAGMIKTDPHALELLIQNGRKFSTQAINAETGVVIGQSVTLNSAGLESKEAAYQLDLNHDGQISLVGLLSVPTT